MACAMAFMTAQAAPPADGQSGYIKQVHGSAWLVDAQGSSRPLRVGDPVFNSDSIVTEADAGAGLLLRDGTAIVVGPSSQLDVKSFHFDAYTRDGGLFVALLRGSLRMITGLIGKTNPEAVRVDTQTATIGIRGTDFIVQADARH